MSESDKQVLAAAAAIPLAMGLFRLMQNPAVRRTAGDETVLEAWGEVWGPFKKAIRVTAAALKKNRGDDPEA